MTLILEQLYLGCLAQASYLIGDSESGKAAIVDPRRDIGVYVEEAEKRGLTIGHVLLTHFHADFVSGHVELRERCGATIHMGAAAEAEYAFEAMAEGDRLELGAGVRLEVLETPGHTPESICLLVYDIAKSADTPHAVLTGDTLFIGDVGRPDLMASIGITKEELAGHLYDSVHGKLMKLPDETLLYPGHGAGSACGKSLSADTVSTIGAQRETNYACQPMEKAKFIELVTAGQSSPPAYFAFDAALNKRDRPTLDAALDRALVALPLEHVVEMRDGDERAQVVDTRDPEVWAAGHLRYSINVGLGGKYATWAGTVLDRERPILIVAEPGKERESALRLGRIGFDHVAGYLEGGPAAFEGKAEMVATVARIEASELGKRLEADAPPVVLDVRNPGEHEAKHIEGAVLIPLAQLRERFGEVPDGPLVVHCAGGYRSMIALSVLEASGIEPDLLSDLRGGIAAWEKAKLALTTS